MQCCETVTFCLSGTKTGNVIKRITKDRYGNKILANNAASINKKKTGTVIDSYGSVTLDPRLVFRSLHKTSNANVKNVLSKPVFTLRRQLTLLPGG
jgi:hypothetical protein